MTYLLKTKVFRGDLNNLVYFVGCSGVAGHWVRIDGPFYQYDLDQGGGVRWWPQSGSIDLFGPVSPDDAEKIKKYINSLR